MNLPTFSEVDAALESWAEFACTQCNSKHEVNRIPSVVTCLCGRIFRVTDKHIAIIGDGPRLSHTVSRMIFSV